MELPTELWIIILTDKSNYVKKARLVCKYWQQLMDFNDIEYMICPVEALPSNKLDFYEYEYIYHWTWLKHFKLSNDFLKYNMLYNPEWDLIAQYQIIDEDILRMHSHEFDNEAWAIISRKQKLSENFMREHFEKLDKSLISKFQYMSKKFISEFESRLDWYYIKQYQFGGICL